VVLSAPSEAALLRAHRELTDAQLPHVLIREPDEPYCGAAMAIGLTPMPREQARSCRAVTRLSLYHPQPRPRSTP